MIVLHSITVVCPRLLTVGDSILFVFLFRLLLYGAPAMSLYWFQYIVTYLLTVGSFRRQITSQKPAFGGYIPQPQQTGLSIGTRSRSSLPIWLLQTCCLFQPSTTSFFVIVAATDYTNTTHNCRRRSFSSRRKPPLERSSTRRYVSSDSRCFPKAAQNLSFLSFVHVVTDAPCTDTPLSGLTI